MKLILESKRKVYNIIKEEKDSYHIDAINNWVLAMLNTLVKVCMDQYIVEHGTTMMELSMPSKLCRQILVKKKPEFTKLYRMPEKIINL